MAAPAQLGQSERCERCGRVVEFRVIAHNAFTDAPIQRWVAVRKTKLAPVPATCPGTGRRRTYHMAEGYHVDGSPR